MPKGCFSTPLKLQTSLSHSILLIYLESAGKIEVFERQWRSMRILTQQRAPPWGDRIKLLVDAVTVTRWLARDQKAHRSKTSVEGLMPLARRDFDAFPSLKHEGLLFNFEGQNSIENVEELLCMEVVVAKLTCVG
jgi:hypothetical protein